MATHPILGRGTYGTVVHSSPRRAHKQFEKAADVVLNYYVVRQVAILKHLGTHPHILGLCSKKVSLVPDAPTLPLQLMDSDLATYVQAHKGLTATTIRAFAMQIIDAVAYINSQGIMHRDLKPANILVNKKRNGIRVGDWDLATSVWCRPDDLVTTGNVVSLGYRPPEILMGHVYTATPDMARIDAWSVGCVILYMLLRDDVFFGGNEVGSLWKIYKFMGSPAPNSSLRSLAGYNDNGPVVTDGSLDQLVPDPAYRVMLRRLLALEPGDRAVCAQINTTVYPRPVPSVPPTPLPRTPNQVIFLKRAGALFCLNARTMHQANMYLDRIGAAVRATDIALAACCLTIASQLYEQYEIMLDDILHETDLKGQAFKTAYMAVLRALNYDLIYVFD